MRISKIPITARNIKFDEEMNPRRLETLYVICGNKAMITSEATKRNQKTESDISNSDFLIFLKIKTKTITALINKKSRNERAIESPKPLDKEYRNTRTKHIFNRIGKI